MNLQYIRVKGASIWHAIEEPLPFGGYRTLCGEALPPRDLGYPTKAEPQHRHEYCDKCWQVEADDNR